jgi:tetratricopeptide (TPR) repeat protein/predicted Ser/Thr protein kinase
MLLDYVEGRLEEAALSRVLAHAQDCSHCREKLALIDTGLLREAHTLTAFLRRAPTLSAIANDHLAAGAHLGRYEVTSLLGVGGMGVVYAARDPDLNRSVAIKLLRPESEPGLAAPLRQRLLREAQTMAQLSHPNVVSVYEVGESGDQIFVAMELVEGRTLRSWLADEKPDWRTILAAYRQAGQALAAAHAVGIVHRDFKPDNVLIDQKGRVRVADFGLARTDSDRTEPATEPDGKLAASLHVSGKLTQTGMLIGTPAYMAPEQLLKEPANALSDQFSFCVSLYEALWQQSPFVGNTIAELARSVVAGELRQPPRNSRVPVWVFRALAKGLRPSPSDRYPSMDALWVALDRDPARVRRRWLVTASMLGLAAVAGGTLIRSRAQSRVCRGAAQKMAGVWDEDRQQAVHKAFAVTGKPFAEAVFNAASATLDEYRRAWTGMYTDACEATRLRGEQSEDAMELRIECLDHRREELGALVDVLTHADAQVVARAPAAVASLPGLDQCRNVDALRQVVPPPPSPQAHQRVATLRSRLAEATARESAGRYSEALELADSIAGDARQLGYAPVLAEALFVRGAVQGDTGHQGAAITTLLDASVAAETGRHDHALADSLMRLVMTLAQQGRFAEAHDYARLARAAVARAGGDPKLEVWLDQQEAVVLSSEGRYDEALALQNRLLPRVEQLFGPDHRKVAVLLNNMGLTYSKKGDPDRALPLFQRAISIYEKANGAGHPSLAMNWNNIGGSLSDKGDYQGALEAFERAHAIFESAVGADHPDTAMALSNMGMTLAELGQPERALTLIGRAHAIEIRANGTEHPNVAWLECDLADVLLKLRRTDAALPHAERCLTIRERTLGSDHPFTAWALKLDGECRLARGERARATQLLERAVAMLEHHPGVLGDLPKVRFTLAKALWVGGRERPRARSLARAARDQFEPIRAEVDAWLAKHR